MTKKLFGDLENDQIMKDAEKRHVMRDNENQKIDAVTENKQMGRLMDEAHIDSILTPTLEPEKKMVLLIVPRDL